MSEGLHRAARWTGLIAAAAAIAPVIGVTPALASSGYKVHLTVPSTVNTGQRFKTVVAGTAKKKAVLSLFFSAQKCKGTAAAEAPHGANFLSTGVVHSYSKSQITTATALGKHYACAYLTAPPPGKVTYAHASTLYTVVKSKPEATLVITPGTDPGTAVYFKVSGSDSAGITDFNLNDGDGHVFDTPLSGLKSDEKLYQGAECGGTFTATFTMTDASGVKTTVSKPYTAPACLS